MYPVKVHPGYGYPDADRDPHLLPLSAGILAELPPATVKIGSLNLPAAGGCAVMALPDGRLAFDPLAILAEEGCDVNGRW